MRPLVIDFSQMAVYEAGALMAVTLAYPDVSETKKAEHFNHLASAGVQHLLNGDPEAALRAHPIKPAYAFHDAARGIYAPEGFEARFRQRLAMGHLAMPFLLRQETGEVRNHPGADRLSLGASFRALHPHEDLDNIRRRWWRPTLPVLHLATALCVDWQPRRAAGETLDIRDILTRRSEIERWVECARAHEPLGAAAFPSVQHCQIRLVLA